MVSLGEYGSGGGFLAKTMEEGVLEPFCTTLPKKPCINSCNNDLHCSTIKHGKYSTSIRMPLKLPATETTPNLTLKNQAIT